MLAFVRSGPARPRRTVAAALVAGAAVVATLAAPAVSASAAPAAVTAKPAVTGLSRSTGPTSGGTRVTVLGTGLKGTRSVRFGARAATSVHVVSDTRVTATAPKGSGLVDVRVTTTTQGTSPASDGDHYLYGGPALAQSDFPGSSGIGPFHIDDVTCPAPGSCVAVGRTGVLGGAPGVYGQPLAFALSGSAWRRIDVPVPTGWQYAELTSVACSAPDTCFAVGAAANGNYPQTSVAFVATNTGDTVTVRTLPAGRIYGPVACGTTPGSCLLASRDTTSTAYTPLPLGSAPVQQGVTLPSASVIGAIMLRCRAAGSCVAWGEVYDDQSRATAFAQHSVDGVWSGTTISPLAGDAGTDLAEVVCPTALTCTGYGNSIRYGQTSDQDVSRPIQVQLATDGTLRETAVPLDASAGQAGEPVDSVACASPTACVGATSDSYNRVNWVDRLTGAGWSSTRVAYTVATGGFRDVTDTRCTATGYCFAIGFRATPELSASPSPSTATVYLPLGAGYAQVDLPKGSHTVVSPAVAACAPTGSFCALVLDDTTDSGLGGQATTPFAVTVRPAG